MNDRVEAAEMLHRATEDWEYLSDEEKYGTVVEALDQLTETGEERMESPTTGNRYIVTRWVDMGDGKIVALNKRPDPEAEHNVE